MAPDPAQEQREMEAAADEKKPRRQTCTDHCSGCGGHFHGLGAFEAHRRDLHCVRPERAYSEKGRKLLQVWTEEGWCDLSPGCWEDGKRMRWEHPVRIWQVAGTQDRLSSLNSKRETAETASGEGQADIRSQGPGAG